MAMKIIKASRGTHEDMLEAFQNRLEDLGVDASTDIYAATDTCDVTAEDLADILNEHGYYADISIPEVREYLTGAAELASTYADNKDDCCEEWYRGTVANFPKDLEWLADPEESSEPVYV